MNQDGWVCMNYTTVRYKTWYIFMTKQHTDILIRWLNKPKAISIVNILVVHEVSVCIFSGLKFLLIL